MADVITRLKLESGEFDSKIQRASRGIQAMAEECHAAGGILNQLEDENRDYIKSLGEMETVSKSARGSLSELTAAFTDLSHVYNQLSEEEKQSEFGQELNKQLGLLKGRIQDGKQELENISKSLNDTGNASKEAGGLLGALKDKFVINFDAVSLLSKGLDMAKGALNTLKDAFFSSEQNIDEWGRITQSAEVSYQLFLDTLNNGNWSNFFSNLNEAIGGARELYNTLDRLGSIKTNNQAAIAILEQELTQLRLRQQNGENVGALIKQKSTELAELKRQSSSQGKKAGLQGYALELKNEYNSQSGANALTQATFDWAARQAMARGQAFYDEQRKRRDDLAKKIKWDVHKVVVNGATNITRTPNYSGMTAREKNNYLLANAITNAETRLGPYIGQYASSIGEETAANTQQYRYNRWGGAHGGSGGGGGGNSTPYEAQTQMLLFGIDQPWWQRFGGSTLQGSIAQLATPDAMKMQSAGWVERGQRNPEIAKIADTMDESSKLIADMSGGVSNIVSGVETLGIEVPDALKKGLSLIQGVTSILTGIASVLLLINSKQTVETVVGIIPGFRTGGIVPHAATGYMVPGNDTSDRTLIAASSGELILNRAQQGVLAGQLSRRASGPQDGGTPYVSGEKIFLGTNNYLESHGQGQLVTTSMLQRMGIA